MPQPNIFQLNIPEADKQEILAALKTLNTKLLPHLKSLPAKTRMELPKMGERSIAFVMKAREYAEMYPELTPPYIDLSTFDADMAAVYELTGFERYVLPMTNNIADSKLLAGSEAYATALIYYRAMRNAAAAEQPNARTIYEDLSSRFPGGSPSTSDNSTGAGDTDNATAPEAAAEQP
ncbi:hypothetical protein [Halioxenophilus sp. WMMB6]|uniref:hypothetical protein n=1 Tax=Halioxenophilus sp. WMMB6 TaxID=3073815 RepID=UPI00295E3FBF|nr:hypothetical protein [Halioxenophilus sp. WMMB6]